MRNCSGIYKIETQNGFYIGSTVKFKDRRNQHLSHLRRGIHANPMLQRAFYKYGESGLIFSVVEECDRAILLDREQYYMDKLSPTYNILSVAGSVDGYQFTDEQKKNVKLGILKNSTPEERYERSRKARAAWTEESKEQARLKHIGRKQSPEAIEKTRKHLIGRPCSPETRAKIALQKGWKQKPEAIEKSRQYMTGRTGKLCPNSKLIKCSNGMTFYGAYEAQRWLRENGFPKAWAARIHAVCRGDRNHTYGMTWSYIDGEM